MRNATALALALAFPALAATAGRAEDPAPPAPLAPEAPEAPVAPPPPAPTASAVEVGLQIGGTSEDDDPVATLHKLPPDVRAKLDANQIADIVRRAQENQHPMSSAEDVIAPVSFFLCIVLVVGAVLFGRYRREKQLHETLRQMIERGVDIPPALLVPPQVKPNDRRRGIILISLGVGGSAFLALVTGGAGGGAWGLGLVPAFLGAGYLLSSFLEKNDGPAT